MIWKGKMNDKINHFLRKQIYFYFLKFLSVSFLYLFENTKNIFLFSFEPHLSTSVYCTFLHLKNKNNQLVKIQILVQSATYLSIQWKQLLDFYQAFKQQKHLTFKQREVVNYELFNKKSSSLYWHNRRSMYVSRNLRFHRKIRENIKAVSFIIILSLLFL